MAGTTQTLHWSLKGGNKFRIVRQSSSSELPVGKEIKPTSSERVKTWLESMLFSHGDKALLNLEFFKKIHERTIPREKTLSDYWLLVIFSYF